MVGFPSFGVLSNVTRKTFDLYIKGRLRQAEPLIVCLIGRLAKQALDCIHPACFCLSAENVSPSRGTRVYRWFAGFCAGFGERLARVC